MNASQNKALGGASMARINIENSLFTRGEWLDLLVRVGSADTALGALVRVWIVSQRYWFPKREPIPADIWKREKLNDAVIESGLAEKRDSGIYVRGSEEQFSWLFEAQIAGQKSGEARKKKSANSSKEPKKPRKTKVVEPRLSTVEARSTEVLPRSTSSLSSLPSSLSSHNSNSPSFSFQSSDEVQGPTPDANREVWDAYRSAYLKRYSQEPVRNKSVNSCIANFVKRLGVIESPWVAAFYVEHNDSFYVRNMHVFEYALKNAESLRTQWAKGKAITQADVRRFEKSQQTATLINSIDQEGI